MESPNFWRVQQRGLRYVHLTAFVADRGSLPEALCGKLLPLDGRRKGSASAESVSKPRGDECRKCISIATRERERNQTIDAMTKSLRVIAKLNISNERKLGLADATIAAMSKVPFPSPDYLPSPEQLTRYFPRDEEDVEER
jgi:hypothetical protein